MKLALCQAVEHGSPRSHQLFHNSLTNSGSIEESVRICSQLIEIVARCRIKSSSFSLTLSLSHSKVFFHSQALRATSLGLYELCTASRHVSSLSHGAVRYTLLSWLCKWWRIFAAEKKFHPILLVLGIILDVRLLYLRPLVCHSCAKLKSYSTHLALAIILSASHGWIKLIFSAKSLPFFSLFLCFVSISLSFYLSLFPPLICAHLCHDCCIVQLARMYHPDWRSVHVLERYMSFISLVAVRLEPTAPQTSLH